MCPPAIKVQRTTIARPLQDVARSSHIHVERCAMSLVYIVRWCCTTSCDLVRPSKINLRYPTMPEISARFLNITHTPKTSGDDPWSPKFTHRKSSYGVGKAGVTVALAITESQNRWTIGAMQLHKDLLPIICVITPTDILAWVCNSRVFIIVWWEASDTFTKSSFTTIHWTLPYIPQLHNSCAL